MVSALRSENLPGAISESCICFGGRQVVRADELEQLSGRTQEEGADGKKSFYRDLRMRLKRGTGFALLAVENQSAVDWEIPLRIMRYDSLEYQRQAENIHAGKRGKRKHEGLQRSWWKELMDERDRLHPIYTVCFYHGTGEWNGPRALGDVMDFGEDTGEWRERFADYPITVINAEDPEVARNCNTG